MNAQSTYLAVDTGSTRISVALGDGAAVYHHAEKQTRSSTQLPRVIEHLLQQAGCNWRDLDGVVAAAGPGSFTGLRVGLAFAMGLHQVLQIPAAAVSTLRLLAAGCDRDEPLTAAVNAWRDSWFIQGFSAPPRLPVGPPQRVSMDELRKNSGLIVACDRVDGTLERHLGISPAEAALSLARGGDIEWDPKTLENPLYLAPAPAERRPDDHRHAAPIKRGDR